MYKILAQQKFKLAKYFRIVQKLDTNFFSNVFLNAYDNLNTLPQTIKPAKIEKIVFVDQFQLFPQV